MGNFNRDNRSGGGRGFERRGFSDRGSRGPVEMHQAVCGKCGKDCEVPFRPTGERPVFCSSCFENNRGSEGRSFERSTTSDEREMFSAICADCGNSCQVPFQPTSGKPVFCSNCFGEKKEGGSRKREQTISQPQYDKQFVELNSKLDKILTMLNPNAVTTPAPEEVVNEIQNMPTEEQTVDTGKKVKVAKKKPAKKK